MKYSLRKKTAFLLIMNAIILSGAAIIIGGSIITNMVDEQYRLKATNLANTMAVTLDVEAVKETVSLVDEIFQNTDERVTSDKWGTPEFDQYISLYSEVSNTDSYKKVLSDLRKVQEVNDVDCIYVAYVDRASELAIYVVDAALEDPCPPGCIDIIYDVNRRVLEDPSVGFPAYITNTGEYGWLVTAGVPIYDNDDIIAYALVDISMDEIKAKQNSFVYILVGTLIVLTILISVISILVVDRNVVKPINTLSQAASKYCEKKDFSRARLDFASIDVHTRDEIEILCESMKQMERDINDNIANLLETTEELSHTRMQADMMNELATKDALTGVRNKMSYDIEMEHLADEVSKGLTKFGIAMIDLNYLKKINDTYGHEKGNVTLLKLCNIICATFVHSPVFRVGGDEFVVILQNTDYDNVKELVDSFKIIIDTVSHDMTVDPWERVSAAIGYALYATGRDKDVNDVFKRADEAMYVCKKEMKSVML